MGILSRFDGVLSSKSRRQEAGLICGSIHDGLGEALDDLTPGSPFLQQLNARSRNARVAYTIILGDGGPLAREDYRFWHDLLGRFGRRCSWGKRLQRALDRHLGGLDELFAGEGDGLVAVRRGQLADVDDIIVGDFQHVEILRAEGTGDVRRIRSLIQDRLTLRE